MNEQGPVFVTVLLKAHEENVISYKCYMCDEVFIGPKDFQSHLKSHSIKNFHLECEICRKTFVKKDCLNRHKVTHEKKFLCNDCPRVFMRKCDLSRHSKSHLRKKIDNNKSMQKAYCKITLQPIVSNSAGLSTFEEKIEEDSASDFRGDSFVEVDNNIANSFHGGNYSCRVCGTVFIRQEDLQLHIRSHFECEICKKRFQRKFDFKRHKMIHEVKEAFDCYLCRRNFARRGDLTRHKKKTHEEGDQSTDTEKKQSKMCEENIMKGELKSNSQKKGCNRTSENRNESSFETITKNEKFASVFVKKEPEDTFDSNMEVEFEAVKQEIKVEN